MLTRNVYIMYPAGYSGSYVSWAINISDLDRRDATVPDPINSSANEKLGGDGTAHLHTRIPTHQGVQRTLHWKIYNQISEPRIYIINPIDMYENGHGIVELARSDPRGIFINIHDEDDPVVRSYGEINCVTKWPTFMAVRFADEYYTSRDREWNIHKDYDPYDCAHDRLFRNFSVTAEKFYVGNRPVTESWSEEQTKKQNIWFGVRNKYQPHEVNDSTYITDINLSGRIFNISCRDIASDRFPDLFDTIMRDGQISDRFDTAQARSFHPRYVAVQKNLQWFDSYRCWADTGIIDDYIRSHVIIEAQIIKHIFRRTNNIFLNDGDRDRWISFYTRVRGPDWPELPYDEHAFWNLPDWVQQEILDFGYKLKTTGPIKKEILDMDWRNMDIDQINDIYQKYR